MNYDFQFTSRFLKFPPVNIEERDNNYFIKFFVPGMKNEDFRIQLDKNVLYVSAVIETSMGGVKQRIFTLKEYDRILSDDRSLYLSLIMRTYSKQNTKTVNCGLRYLKNLEAIKPRKEMKVF